MEFGDSDQTTIICCWSPLVSDVRGVIALSAWRYMSRFWERLYLWRRLTIKIDHSEQRNLFLCIHIFIVWHNCFVYFHLTKQITLDSSCLLFQCWFMSTCNSVAQLEIFALYLYDSSPFLNKVYWFSPDSIVHYFPQQLAPFTL